MLINKLNQIIKHNGFIELDNFMRLVLTDPEFGYYTSSLPIGAAGDFTTAPEISQLFGEMLAFFIIHNWNLLGRPKKLHLLEFGPGRGTLMLDILNIIKKVPEVFEKIEVYLVEISNTLTSTQANTLKEFSSKISWHKDFNNLQINAPVIIIANEFFDALPVKQFKYVKQEWHEVNIKYINNKFEFVLNNTPAVLNHLIPPYTKIEEGMVFEYSPAILNCLNQFNQIIQQYNGVAVVIDYGYTVNTYQSTLQALHKHNKVNFLENIGDNDLTALVNFPLLISYLKQINSHLVVNINSQRDFLIGLGIKERLQILLEIATNNEKDAIISGVERIINEEDMGSLFKVLTFSNINN